jgi:HEAT repeat protein
VAENADPVVNEVRVTQRRAIGALHSAKNTADRLTAIHELEGLHTVDKSITTSALVDALDDADIKVRIAAVDALGASGYVPASSPSELASLRAAAIGLTRCVQHANPRLRAAVVQNLGAIGANLVKSGSDGPAVCDAANALMACLDDPEAGVRSAAATSLGKIDSRKLAAMTTPSFNRQALMDALAKMLGDGEEAVRLAAVSAVAAHPLMNGDPVPALANGLTDETPMIRVATIRSLVVYRQGLDPWLPLLLHHAEHDPDPLVREECISASSWAFNPRSITATVVPDLIHRLKSDDGRVRSLAAWILASLRADALAAIPELLVVLNEPLAPHLESAWTPRYNLDPASAAARALGQIGPGSSEERKVVVALMEVVRGGPESRRGWAAAALGEFRSSAVEAVPVLIKLMSDAAIDNTFQRTSSAASALGKIAPGSPLADQALAVLLTGLDSKISSVQLSAVQALGLFGAKAAAAIPKISALQDDRDMHFRNAAVQALALIEGRDE